MIATVTLNPSLDEWIELPALTLGALNRAAAFARYPGGKGINVSRVAHELRVATRAYTLIGGGDGHILKTLLDRLGIPQSAVAIPGTTRNNYKIRTRRPQALTELNTPGPTVGPRPLRMLYRRLVSARPRPSHVALCGSLPPGPPASIYRTWITSLNPLGISTVLDASGAALAQGIRARPWLIKPNRQEAEEVLGRRLSGRAELVHGLQALLDQGPRIVVLSLGADGALLGSREPAGVWFAKPPVVQAQSAVGAGDAMVAGILVGWVRRRSLTQAFRLGVACGTAAARSPGTDLCRRADVLRLLRRVTVTRLR